MSGRGGRGRGHVCRNMTRRGRGQGQHTGRSNNKNKPSYMATIKTKMSEHIYHIGSDRQGSDFVLNKRLILNHIQSQFVYGEDIATALENREELAFKVRDKSPKLPRSRAERFHTVTAQGLFLCKHGSLILVLLLRISQQECEAHMKMLGRNM